MALQGTIDSFAVADVLRLLESSGQVGRLVVSGERGTASIWVDDGAIVDGVLVDVLRFRAGSFVFEAGVRSDNPHQRWLISEAIAQASSDLDELQRLSERILSPDRLMCAVPNLATEQVTLDRELWHSVAQLFGLISVAEFSEQSGVGEVDALRRVTQLMDLGLIELGDPPRSGTLEPATAEPAALEPATLERVTADLAWVPPNSALDESPDSVAGWNEVVGTAPIRPQIDAAWPETPTLVIPRVEADVPDGLDELFGDFDPFAGPSTFGSTDRNHLGDQLVPTGVDILHALHPPAESADPQDLARQMAMLSPRAAHAVAAAVGGMEAPPGVEDEPEGREHVVRFLDSVQ